MDLHNKLVDGLSNGLSNVLGSVNASEYSDNVKSILGNITGVPINKTNPTAPSHRATPEVIAETKRLVDEGQFANAVEYYRSKTGVSLNTARAYIESLI